MRDNRRNRGSYNFFRGNNGQRDANRTTRSIDNTKEDRVCFFCNIQGHLRRDCYAYKRDMETARNKRKGDQIQVQNAVIQTGEKMGNSQIEVPTNFINRETGKLSAENNVIKIKEGICETNFGRDMKIECIVGGKKSSVLVDSGSEVTICSVNFWGTMEPKPLLVPSPFDNIVAVNGGEARIVGSIHVMIKIGEFSIMQQIQVIQGTHYEVIIGRDFMENKHTADIGKEKQAVGSVAGGTLSHALTEAYFGFWGIANLFTTNEFEFITRYCM